MDGGAPPLVVFSPYDWQTHEDPYPVYRRLRDEAPCYCNEELGFYALSRYEDVLAGFRDWEGLSNEGGVSLEQDQQAVQVQQAPCHPTHAAIPDGPAVGLEHGRQLTHRAARENFVCGVQLGQ